VNFGSELIVRSASYRACFATCFSFCDRTVSFTSPRDTSSIGSSMQTSKTVSLAHLMRFGSKALVSTPSFTHWPVSSISLLRGPISANHVRPLIVPVRADFLRELSSSVSHAALCAYADLFCADPPFALVTSFMGDEKRLDESSLQALIMKVNSFPGRKTPHHIFQLYWPANDTSMPCRQFLQAGYVKVEVHTVWRFNLTREGNPSSTVDATGTFLIAHRSHKTYSAGRDSSPFGRHNVTVESMFSVIPITPPSPSNPHPKALNPFQKSIDVSIKILDNWCPPGGTVMSFYSGTHSIERACLATGRECVGFETDLEQINVSAALFEKMINSLEADPTTRFSESEIIDVFSLVSENKRLHEQLSALKKEEKKEVKVKSSSSASVACKVCKNAVSKPSECECVVCKLHFCRLKSENRDCAFKCGEEQCSKVVCSVICHGLTHDLTVPMTS